MPTRAEQVVLRKVERAADDLTRRALADLDGLTWWATLDADSRSGVGLVVQAGIHQFAGWLRDGSFAGETLAFGAAPAVLTRTVSLAQTVEIVRRSVDVVEHAVDELAAEPLRPWLREQVLRYSREVAFAAASVYARAAEQRGAWDARLQTLLVDAVVAGDAERTVDARASALGWTAPTTVVAVAAGMAADDVDASVVRLQRSLGGHPAVAGAHGSAVLVLCSPLLVDDVVLMFDDGPIVVGPLADSLGQASTSAKEALAALRVVRAWPQAPRPVTAADLLPERAIAGELVAVQALIREVYLPLVTAGGSLLETTAHYLEETGTLEATARALFVHPNTVRYRLGRVAEITGLHPAHPRDAFVLRTALVAGRLPDL